MHKHTCWLISLFSLRLPSPVTMVKPRSDGSWNWSRTVLNIEFESCQCVTEIHNQINTIVRIYSVYIWPNYAVVFVYNYTLLPLAQKMGVCNADSKLQTTRLPKFHFRKMAFQRLSELASFNESASLNFGIPFGITASEEDSRDVSIWTRFHNHQSWTGILQIPPDHYLPSSNQLQLEPTWTVWIY